MSMMSMMSIDRGSERLVATADVQSELTCDGKPTEKQNVSKMFQKETI
jgi:hypothetical protein